MGLIYLWWCMHDVIRKGAGGDSIEFYSCAHMSFVRGPPPQQRGLGCLAPHSGSPCSVDAVPRHT